MPSVSECNSREQMYVDNGFFFLLPVCHRQLFVPHFCKIRTTAVLLSRLFPLRWWCLFIALKHMTLFCFFFFSFLHITH